MRRGLILCALLLGAGATAIAFGAQVGSGGQVASFDAKLSPGKLPRDHLAPVKIRVEGEFKATPDNHLAQLRSLEVGVNRHGKLNTRGMPICRMRDLGATTTADALKVCGGALIGKGLVRATTSFPDQGRSHFQASLSAFNSRRPNGGGRVLLHIHGVAPGPFTVVIPIEVRRTKGTFGTTFFAELPGFARRWAYLTKFRFVIGGKFWDEGREKSAVLASCPAPKGLNGALFPFARATYRFMTTKTLRTTLIGGCQVRKEPRRHRSPETPNAKSRH